MTCEHDNIEWGSMGDMKETSIGMFSLKGTCENCKIQVQEIWEFHGKYDMEGKEI